MMVGSRIQFDKPADAFGILFILLCLRYPQEKARTEQGTSAMFRAVRGSIIFGCDSLGPEDGLLLSIELHPLSLLSYCRLLWTFVQDEQKNLKKSTKPNFFYQCSSFSSP